MSYSVCIPLPSTNELQKHWDFALSNFAPEALYVIGDEGQAPSTNVFARLNASYLDTAEQLPVAPLIVLAPAHGHYVAGEVSLAELEHPEGAIYLFGPDNLPLSSDHLGIRESRRVFIPTDSTDDMYSYAAYAVTMWDRVIKHG